MREYGVARLARVAGGGAAGGGGGGGGITRSPVRESQWHPSSWTLVPFMPKPDRKQRAGSGRVAGRQGGREWWPSSGVVHDMRHLPGVWLALFSASQRLV